MKSTYIKRNLIIIPSVLVFVLCNKQPTSIKTTEVKSWRDSLSVSILMKASGLYVGQLYFPMLVIQPDKFRNSVKVVWKTTDNRIARTLVINDVTMIEMMDIGKCRLIAECYDSLKFMIKSDSIDLRCQWKQTSSDVHSYINSIVPDRRGYHLFAGVSTDKALLFSADGGDTWLDDYATGLPSAGVSILGDFSRNPEKMIAVTEDEIWSEHSHFWRSFDHGKTWGKARSPQLFHSIQTSPLNESKLYMACEEGVYASDDFGDTWSYITPGFTTNSIYVDPSDGNHVYCPKLGYEPYSPKTWYHSNDGGKSWNDSLVGKVMFVEKIDDFGRCFTSSFETIMGYPAGGKISLAVSEDHMHTWRKLGEPMNGTFLNSLASHPESRNLLAASTSYEGIYISTDGGESWKLSECDFISDNGVAAVHLVILKVDPVEIVMSVGRAFWKYVEVR